MKFFTVTVLSGLLTLLRLCCGFLISKIVAVYTGTSGVAALGQLQSFVTLVNGFVSSQVSQGLTRYTSEYKDDYNNTAKYWSAAAKLSSIAAAIIIIMGCFSSKYISNFLFSNPQYYWIIILSLLVVPLNILNSILLAVVNGLEDYRKYFLTNAVAIVLFLISMATFVYFFGKTGALISAALNNAISGLYLLSIIYKERWFKLKYWFSTTDKQSYKNMLNYFYMGIIGALTGPLSIIMVRSIITSDLSIDDAGYWQATLKISEAYLAVLTTALTVYYFPKTAMAKTKKEHLYILRKGIILIVPLAILAATTIFLLRDFILIILFTNDFSKASSLFLFQNIGDVFRVSSWLFAVILLAKGYFKINAILEIIFSLSFPVLTKILIEKYGFTTPSIAYCINYSLYFITVLLVYIWHIKRLKQ